MKTTLTLVTALALLTSAFAESPSEQKSSSVAEGGKPYKVGSSYLIVVAPISPVSGMEVPKGTSKVIAESGNWIRVEYSSFKDERSKSDPGQIVKSETVYRAWLNLDHIVAFVDEGEAKLAAPNP